MVLSWWAAFTLWGLLAWCLRVKLPSAVSSNFFFLKERGKIEYEPVNGHSSIVLWVSGLSLMCMQFCGNTYNNIINYQAFLTTGKSHFLLKNRSACNSICTSNCKRLLGLCLLCICALARGGFLLLVEYVSRCAFSFAKLYAGYCFISILLLNALSLVCCTDSFLARYRW